MLVTKIIKIFLYDLNHEGKRRKLPGIWFRNALSLQLSIGNTLEDPARTILQTEVWEKLFKFLHEAKIDEMNLTLIYTTFFSCSSTVCGGHHPLSFKIGQ